MSELRIAVTKKVGTVPEEKGSGVWAFLLLNQRSKDRFTSIKDLCKTVEREDSLYRIGLIENKEGGLPVPYRVNRK
jgi:hypothetical protein